MAVWRVGRVLTDTLLAASITDLHQQGKSLARISQVAAAVRRATKNQVGDSRNGGVEISWEITDRTFAGIRQLGKDRDVGRSGVLSDQMWTESVYAFREVDKILAVLQLSMCREQAKVVARPDSSEFSLAYTPMGQRNRNQFIMPKQS